MTIQSGNDKERAVSWNRAKAGTIATVVLLVAVVTAAAVAATPGSRPEVEDNGRAEHGARPLKADLEAREAAFLEHLDAKVEAGELTRAEADEMIANMEDQHAEHLKGTDRGARPLKADLAERKAAFLEGLDAKVEAGELTRAEADEMIAGLKARIAEHAKRDARPSKADLAERKAAFLEGLDAKVEAGELTRAEADEMIAGMKARIAEHLKGAERDARPLKADLAERRAAFLEGLDAKVEAGELTRAEADEMIAGLKARIAEHLKGAKRDARPSKADLAERKAAFLEGLDAKVEAGELTRAEADEIVAKVEARHARHRQRTTGDTPDMSAALALARS